MAVLRGRSPAAASVKQEGWQAEAWAHYDHVGELRFGAGWIGNALSRVNLVAALPPTRPGDDPTTITLDDDRFTPSQRRAAEIVADLAGGPLAQAQMLHTCGVLLSVDGVAYIVARPSNPDLDVLDDWAVYSSAGFRLAHGSTPTDPRYEVRDEESRWTPLPDSAVVVKVWRRHPKHRWLATAPTQAVLPVLAEIRLLSDYKHAAASSRLAGAGVLMMPREATFAPLQPDTDPDPDDDPLVDVFIETARIAKQDPSDPAALIPIVVRLPGDLADKVKHITFTTPFDAAVPALLDQAIRRLALGLDLPPEVLTGVGGVNHWTAWQVEESAITLHVQPLAALICEALWEGFLRPALAAERIADDVIIWYDTTNLTTRPDRSTAAATAYQAGILSDEAYVREIGLSVDDLADVEARRERVLLAVARGAPTLAPMLLADLGYLDRRVAEALTGIALADSGATTTPTPTTPTPDRSTPTRPVDPPDPDDERDAVTAAALLEAADALVTRAIERAGARLVTAARPAFDLRDVPYLTVHSHVDATSVSDLDSLLDGAWVRVPEIAARLGVDPDALTATLDAYTRAILATGRPHEHRRLADILHRGE